MSPGTRIGAYEVISLIGAGGMGEVYLARDTQLGRNVALKVLPAMFASDAERLARFRREAQILAALHHPNIAVIYGFEDADGAPSLVLEYIEGDTLAERISSGVVPFDEALGIARQIAEALQAAHDHGVIHRDLKPSNIKLTPDGTVRVLDFGLAKLAAPAEAAAGGTSSVSLSPTITSPASTTLGVILGTAAYMAPEQAKGKPADKRSDVWAFGSVLFEMLTGKRAFEGDDISDTLASVLKGEPDWNALPADVPPSIVTLLRHCLAKDPRARLGDISGALFVIRNHGAFVQRVAQDPPPASRRRLTSRDLIVGAVAVSARAATSAAVGWRAKPGPPDPIVTRFGVSLPTGDIFTNPGRNLLAIAPDGRRYVFVAGSRLNVRAMDQLESTPIRGTEGTGNTAPRGPFFSPDGQWIGYWSGTQLKRISINGGAAAVVTSIPNQPFGAHWTSENTIVFSDASAIWRVADTTGKPEMLVKSEGGRRFQHPQLLPGGRALLYTAVPPGASWDQADIVVKPLDGGSERKIVVGNDGRYVATGHIVFVVRGTLMAVPFDLSSLTASSGPVALFDGVTQASNQSGAAHFDISSNGTLVYITQTLAGGGLRRPVWIDRQGKETPLTNDSKPYLYVRVSPDESRIAFDIADPGNRDIYVWEVAQGAMRRLTTDPTPDRAPVFTRDSRRIIFSSDRAGSPSLFWISADGVGDAQRLTTPPAAEAHFASTTAPDGTVLLRRGTGGGGTSVDVFSLAMDGDRKLTPLIAEDFTETNAEVSHNGRWIAYQTNRSGGNEVHVRPYPAVNTDWPVSTAGGSEPLWSSDDRELFYRSSTGAIMRVQVKATGDAWSASMPEQVLPGDGLRMGLEGSPYRTFDVSKDGKRFLVLKEVADTAESPVVPDMIVVQHWFEELTRKVPRK